VTTRAHTLSPVWLWPAILLILAAGCRAAPVPPPPPTPSPLPTPRPEVIMSAPTTPRVVVVAVPGMMPATLKSLFAQQPTPVPTLQRLAGRGRTAAVVPVQPPLASPSLASLATGALPADHRALSNALDVSVLARPTLWQRATEAGLRAAVIDWPHAIDPPWPQFWVARRGRFADAAQHTVTLAPVSSPWANAPASFSPPLEGRIPLRLNERDVGTIWVLALDTQDDGLTEYDTFILDTDRAVGPESATLSARRPWASLQVAADAGVDLKYQGLAGRELTMFQSEALRFRARPPELEQALWGALGFFPPDADAQAYTRGWIEGEDLLRMAARQTAWLAGASALVARTYAPDLLMTSWPILAQITPPTLLVDPAQPGWQPQRENDLEDVRRRAYTAADDGLFTLVSTLDLSRTALFVVSPYGFTPVHTDIDLLALLVEWDLMPLSPEGDPLWAQAPVRVVVEGSIAWLWPASPTEAPAELRATLREKFSALTDPASGQRPVATLISDEELARSALWTLSTREALFVQLQPGYRFVLGPGTEVFRHTSRYGASGYSPEVPDMAGWALAVGRGIVPGGEEAAVALLDIPATAATLLGIEWPLLAHGTPLDEWLQLP